MPNSFTWRFVRDYSGNQDRKGFGLPVLTSTAGRSCCKLASTRIQTETWIHPSHFLSWEEEVKLPLFVVPLFLPLPCFITLPRGPGRDPGTAPACSWVAWHSGTEMFTAVLRESAAVSRVWQCWRAVKWPSIPVTTQKQGSAGPPLGPPVLLSLSAVTLPLLCPQMRENLGTSPCLASCLILRSTIW